MFIPIAPRQIVAYSSYRQFMLSCAQAIKAADPSALANVIEIG